MTRPFSLDNYGAFGITLDGEHDDSPGLNTLLAGTPPNATFQLPDGAALASLARLLVGVAGHQLAFGAGAKLALLPGAGTMDSFVDLAADDLVTRDMEIAGDPTATAKISGWRALSSPKRTRLLGRTYVHDTTDCGGKAPGVADIHIEDYRAVNTVLCGLRAQNNVNTGPARVIIDRSFIDRSMRPASGVGAASQPNLQIIGTPDNYTLVLLSNIENRGVIEPVDHTAECCELRYCRGKVAGYDSLDGSMGLSIVYGDGPLVASAIGIKGPNLFCLEFANTGNKTLIGFSLDGTNSAGVAVCRRVLCIDGMLPDAKIAVIGGTIKGATDSCVFVNSNGWADLDFVSVDVDASKVTGAIYGERYGFNFVAQPGSIGSKRTMFQACSVHGGGAATRALRAVNPSGLFGHIAVDGINGPLVEIVADNYRVDNIRLTIDVGDGCPASGHILLTPINGGSFGDNIHFNGNGLVPGAQTGFLAATQPLLTEDGQRIALS
jgi:hypothetical protein